MTMYMDGFRSPLLSYLFHHQPDANTTSSSVPPCLNFLFRGWTLDTPTKFLAAMMVVIILGIGVEAIAAVRSGDTIQYLFCHRRRRHPALTPYQRVMIKMTAVGSHVLQAGCGYVLMLAAMSYSVEMLISVLFGLGVGYAACFEQELPGSDGDIDNDNDADDDIIGNDGNDENELDVDRHRGDRATPRNSSGTTGAGTCCGVGAGGRGPPRQAFRFRSPVPTLEGVGPNRRRDEMNQNIEDGDDAQHPVFLSEEGADDYLSLQEDDKMTPLL